MTERKIITEQIQTKSENKWLAYYEEDGYEQPCGWGKSPEEAIIDLKKHREWMANK